MNGLVNRLFNGKYRRQSFDLHFTSVIGCRLWFDSFESEANPSLSNATELFSSAAVIKSRGVTATALRPIRWRTTARSVRPMSSRIDSRSRHAGSGWDSAGPAATEIVAPFGNTRSEAASAAAWLTGETAWSRSWA